MNKICYRYCMTYYIAGRWIITLYYSGDFTRNEVMHSGFTGYLKTGSIATEVNSLTQLVWVDRG